MLPGTSPSAVNGACGMRDRRMELVCTITCWWGFDSVPSDSFSSGFRKLRTGCVGFFYVVPVDGRLLYSFFVLL